MTQRFRNQEGMTLMEIMVAITILVVLKTIFVVNVMERLDEAKISEAKIQIAEITKALEQYYLRKSSYPSTEEGLEALIPSYMKKMPKDPWSKEYYYELVKPRQFRLVTGGPDQMFDTEDDIASDTMEEGTQE